MGVRDEKLHRDTRRRCCATLWSSAGVCPSHLEHQQEEEVSVGDPLKLLKQVEGQEGEEVVLGGFDGVCLRGNDGRRDVRGGLSAKPKSISKLWTLVTHDGATTVEYFLFKFCTPKIYHQRNTQNVTAFLFRELNV